MVERVQSTNGNTPYQGGNHSAVKEKMRASYNEKTQTFAHMKAGETQKIDKMSKAEGLVAKQRVPVDYTSQAFLTKVDTKMKSKVKELKTATKNVGAYVSGKASEYTSFIQSVSEAKKKG